MPAGRPTKYDPDFHPQDFIRLSSLGLCKAEIAEQWDVCEDTIYRWSHEKEEFSDALRIGHNRLKGWYMRFARENMNKVGFNDRQWANMSRLLKLGEPSERIHVFEKGTAQKSSQDKANEVFEKLYSGELTAKEAKIHLEVIALGMNITEVKELWNKVEAIEKERRFENDSDQAH